MISAILAFGGIYLVFRSHAATNNADFNNDGTVNITDLSILASHWNQTGLTQSQGDANGDGAANIIDLSILATQWGTNPGGGGTTQTTNCAPNPHLCGFPDATNTGIQSGVALTQIPSQATSGGGSNGQAAWYADSGNKAVYVVTSGTVGSATTGLELADGWLLVIDASNVTAQNIKIDGAHGQNTGAVTQCSAFAANNNQYNCRPSTNWPFHGVAAPTSSADNFAISYCDIGGSADSAGFDTPTRGNAAVQAINGSPAAAGTTVDHCNIHGFSVGYYPQIEFGNIVISNNYMHGFACWAWNVNGPCTTNQGGSSGWDHLNGIEVGGGPGGSGSSMLVQHNTIIDDGLCCEAGAIEFYNDSGATNNVANLYAVIDHNIVGSGGGRCFNWDTVYSTQQPDHIAWIYNIFTQYHPRLANYSDTNCSPDGIWAAYTIGPVNNSYSCGDYWDNGVYAGSGADGYNGYPGTQYGGPAAMQAVTTCSAPAWTIPGMDLSPPG